MELQEIYSLFETQNDCTKFLESVRWRNAQKCPKCGSEKHSKVKNRYGYHCNFCNRTFTVTTNTVFHRSQVDLQKWFFAIYVTLSPSIDLSARGLADNLSIAKDTAWLMQKKIKNALITTPDFLFNIETRLNTIIWQTKK